jgi:O-antigen ligase
VGEGRGARATTVAAASLTAAAAASPRLVLANFILIVTAVSAWMAWRSGALRGRPWARPLCLPLAIFALLSLVSAVASIDPLTSLSQLPRLLVLLLVPLAAALIDMTWWRRLIIGLAVMTTVLGVWGIVQYLQGANDLSHRIAGPMPHYMTYSGWLTVSILVLFAELIFEKTPSRWLLLMPVIAGGIAVLLSYTRNAWVGIGFGLLVLAAVWRRRVLLLYPVLAVVIWLVFPRAVLDRALSIVDLRQPANYDRLCMIASGAEMVRDHPWTGVGLDMVSRVYPLYRRDDAPRWRVPHLHNNSLQIAAERGLPALGAYLWLIGAFVFLTWRALVRLDGPYKGPMAAALIAVAGITVAGLFEYNFWDAEVQYLTLVVMGAGMGMVGRGLGEAG